MKRRTLLIIPSRASLLYPRWQPTSIHYQRCIHSSYRKYAVAHAITHPGPPPSVPLPAASRFGERVDRRRRQAELVKRGREIRSNQAKPNSAQKKRFWKDVSVKTDEDGVHTIYLDTRPVRNPQSKIPLPIASSKPHLATAIALEWDLLVSAQQALRSHLIPLTSLAARAHDLLLQDTTPAAASSAPHSSRTIRDDIIATILPYLDTDTLLCWAPPSSEGVDASEPVTPSLRDLQIRTAQPIISYLTSNVWPGVQLNPSFNANSIIPDSQPAASKDVIRGWMAGLNAWELVGLERAVLAGKSLCVGARLVVEWGESFADLRAALGTSQEAPEKAGQRRFGIEEAAEACSVEVRWQTGQWGEVEDTHDVEKEDLRRQFGSTIVLVSGTGQ
ncbi:MAG: hypothetical protein Q9214_001291 [Letrouitia sp. 1 TL-2023]